jgi:hypothetical protein
MGRALDTPFDALERMGRVGRQRVEAAHDARQNAAQLGALFRS